MKQQNVDESDTAKLIAASITHGVRGSLAQQKLIANAINQAGEMKISDGYKGKKIQGGLSLRHEKSPLEQLESTLTFGLFD